MEIRLVSKWKPLFRPQKICKYVNDHTIFTDKNGNLRLLGTCSDNYSVLGEKYFVEAVTKDISKEMKEVGVLFKNDIYTGPKIAPYVFYDPKSKKYHLFFSPMMIRHYVSKDGTRWEKVKGAVRSIWPALRDPHVISYNNYYLMYLTDFGNKISVYKSEDLYSWKKVGVAFKAGEGNPKSFNSSCESPFVMPYKKGFLLFTTIVPGRFNVKGNLKYYNNTRVYYSKSPLYFDNKNLIAKVEAHAPEIIEINKKYYLSTCGWNDSPKPNGVNEEGVFIKEFILV